MIHLPQQSKYCNDSLYITHFSVSLIRGVLPTPKGFGGPSSQTQRWGGSRKLVSRQRPFKHTLGPWDDFVMSLWEYSPSAPAERNGVVGFQMVAKRTSVIGWVGASRSLLSVSNISLIFFFLVQIMCQPSQEIWSNVCFCTIRNPGLLGEG